jgi:hypothetical protein
MKELLTCIMETLEIEDVRVDVIKYAMNSELFFAFPL